ncbi:tripartite tricarboxylate transporter permease [Campylobacter fetus]|uniref:tripartite tricarboxylate transporter permease n=1 Tax=Campylobacter fetus TaxID=196 RepID=UPI000ACDD00E|nr:tripartite tricarboxylate transporter permease [Campylobacter fetus]
MATTESANNASAGGAMKPMLTLGIPGSRTTAVLLGEISYIYKLLFWCVAEQQLYFLEL